MNRLGGAVILNLWRALHALCLVAAFLFCAGAAFAQAAIQYDLSDTSVLRIRLPQSQSTTVAISQPVGKIAVANPDIADAQQVTDSSLYVIGKTLGRTTINLYSPDTAAPVGLIEVEVSVDASDIARSIKAALPNSSVKVSTVNGRVRLSGTVADALEMGTVLAIVAQYTDSGVINTITLGGKQQVNLEVRILEASRAAARQLGIQLSGNIGPVAVNANGNRAPAQTSIGSMITGLINTGIGINVAIEALETKNLVRTLAEPNLTTLSGEAASFLAGGQVPVRVPDENGQVTLQYKDFGVKLVFTPVVLADDRIQIRLAPEVSDLTQFTPAGDPQFSTRTLSSTIELRDGQSFSVAGLMQSHGREIQNQLPWLGQVPILGALFRSSSYQKDETELVVIVTPRLVQPAPPGQPLATPLDKTEIANDGQFFALGQLEVSPKMIKAYENGDGVVGPFGHIIDLEDK